MNNDQHQQPPMNGNDDLAKTLNEGLQFEETPMNGESSSSTPPAAPSSSFTAHDDEDKMPSLASSDDDDKDMTDDLPEPPTLDTTPPADEPDDDDDDDKKDDDKSEDESTTNAPASTGDTELDDLKASALDELRPLVGKLNLPAEERFDTLLLIIRSTDDQALLSQAHDAAKEITDDARRAQALLDVIKEIDYFSSKR